MMVLLTAPTALKLSVSMCKTDCSEFILMRVWCRDTIFLAMMKSPVSSSFGRRSHDYFDYLRNCFDRPIEARCQIFGEEDISSSTAEGFRFIEVPYVGVGCQNHVTLAKCDSIIWVRGHTIKDLGCSGCHFLGGLGLMRYMSAESHQ